MRFPIAIHKETDSAYGVTVPDIPGCFSAGETVDQALDNAMQAIKAHLKLLAEENELPPVAATIDHYMSQKEYEGAMWSIIDIDVSRYSGKTEKINVSMPCYVTTLIDDLVNEGRAKSRSAFLAEAGLEKLQKIQE